MLPSPLVVTVQVLRRWQSARRQVFFRKRGGGRAGGFEPLAALAQQRRFLLRTGNENSEVITRGQ
jgi:hypothetical protein